MTKYFTNSPYEKEMMEIPYVPMEKSKKDEFRKLLSYHNSCKFCMYYSQGKDKCKRTVCPFVNERIKKKCITLLELIPPILYEVKDKKFYKRILDLYTSLRMRYSSLLIGEYIHYYNNFRIQTKTKLTPLEKRNQFVA